MTFSKIFITKLIKLNGTFEMKLNVVFFELWLDCFIYNNQYILWLVRNYRKIKKFLLLLSSPYLLLNWIVKIIFSKTFGYWHIARLKKKEKGKEFDHEVAIVAIAKNEGLYIKEWIEYHRLLGITKIYFYDNCSEDRTTEILKPYEESGIVEYQLIEGRGKQLEVYNDAIEKHKFECRYIAFIDLDEYIMPEKPYEKIPEVIQRVLSVRKNACGVAVNWCVYGNSGHESRPNGLITESYIDRAKETWPINHQIKTVCNPRMVNKYVSPHYPQYRLGAISVDSTGKRRSKGWFCRDLTFKNIRLNHYYCKSVEDFRIKASRGFGDRSGGVYTMRKYEDMNRNDVHDESMLAYREDLLRLCSIEPDV